MKYVFILLLPFSIVLFPLSIQAQSPDSIFVIKLSGRVFDAASKRPVSSIMVVNKRTQQGFFSGNGVFEVRLFSTDTLLIGSTGYQTTSICLMDSILKEELDISFYMAKLSYQAREVEVFGARDLDKIQEDIEKLGYNKKDYMLSDVDALNSPITFLYQQFSRKERAKRDLAELKNNDRRRSLLKELFSKYVATDIMNLETSEFDQFIDFCNVSDEFMKNSSQYDFIIYIKRKYAMYRMMQKENVK